MSRKISYLETFLSFHVPCGAFPDDAFVHSARFGLAYAQTPASKPLRGRHDSAQGPFCKIAVLFVGSRLCGAHPGLVLVMMEGRYLEAPVQRRPIVGLGTQV